NAGLVKLRDRGTDLLQRNSGIEQSLHKLQHENVAEAVQPLGARSPRTLHGGLNQTGACPVVELTVANTSSASSHCALVSPVGVRQSEAVRQGSRNLDLSRRC